MIKSLDYTVTFASTGRTLSNRLSFSKGLTTITGPNETGKSMVIELIRWCLFGSEALRGSTDDYSTLKATLVFTLLERDYRIDRSLKGGTLKLGDEVLCTGTRPLNSKIIELLGFDLEVFDITCAVNQNLISQLSDMRPAERKRMVDRVIGSDKIEELGQWCGEEALLVSREIAVLEKALVEPESPEPPEGYRPSEFLQAVLTQQREAERELNQLLGWLKNEPNQPAIPTDPGVGVSLDNLRAAEELFQFDVHDFDPLTVQGEWTRYDLWMDRLSFETRNPRPSLTSDQVTELMLRWELELELKQLKKSPILTCPCGQPFTTSDTRIAEVETALEKLPASVPGVDLQSERLKLTNWGVQTTLSEWERVKVAVEIEKPSVDRDRLQRALAGRSISDTDLRSRLDALRIPQEWSLSDVRRSIREIETYRAQRQAYEPLKEAYDRWHEEAKEKVDRVDELTPIASLASRTEFRLREAAHYETVNAQYEKEKKIYDQRLIELTEKKEEQASWKTSKVGFNTLRESIKSHLVPSLSKQASTLMNRMTGGARSSVIVDGNFEVTVDGQPLSTLSGSGKACANLALRIGLGQVLTNNLFSVFIGDEIDASMDDNRAENLKISLGILKDRISQIIIVTHKSPEADHKIVFGDQDLGHQLHS